MEIFQKAEYAADAISLVNGLCVCAFSKKEVCILPIISWNDAP
jgi:hypothetical protein